jgi:hypothetical protein
MKSSLSWALRGRGALSARPEGCIIGQQRGAVVVGVQGSRKTALVIQVLRRHACEILKVRLRGTASQAAEPYDSFNVLLSRLPDEVLGRSPRIVPLNFVPLVLEPTKKP